MKGSNQNRQLKLSRLTGIIMVNLPPFVCIDTKPKRNSEEKLATKNKAAIDDSCGSVKK